MGFHDCEYNCGATDCGAPSRIPGEDHYGKPGGFIAKKIDEEIMEQIENRAEILNVLLSQIGDTRKCPCCYVEFIPGDATQRKTIDLYNKLKYEGALTILEQAKQELDKENLRLAIDKEKEKIQAKRPFLHKIFPWKIKITRV